MGVFPNKKYVSAAGSNTVAARYRAALAKRPFLFFGLPFLSIIVAGSFVLTPATAVRYEKHDRKVRQMTREEELGVGKQGRKVNIKDEYYVSSQQQQQQLPRARRGHSHATACVAANLLGLGWDNLLTSVVFHSGSRPRTSTTGSRSV